MKFFFLLFIFVAGTGAVYSQPVFKRNDVYAELGGSSLFVALNYERQLGKKPGFGVRAGAGLYGITPSYLTFPLGLHYLIKLKTKNRFLELGAGATLTKAEVLLYAVVKREFDVKPSLVKFVPSLAYRAHMKKKVLCRISFTLVSTTVGLLPYFGISAGKRF